MPATLRRTDEALEVDLSTCSRGGDFMDTLAKVKDIAGRRFDGERKLWLLPPEPQIAEKAIHSLQPAYDSKIMEWVIESKHESDAELVTALPDDADDLLIPWAEHRAPWQPEQIRVGKEYEDFNGLKAHQRAWVSEVSKGEQVRVILADDMGLGKTFQIISAIAERAYRAGLGHYDDEGFDSSEAGAKLIVCPRSVRPVWAREIERWLGPREFVQVIDGSTKERRAKQLQEVIERRGWAVINYEQLRVVKEERKTRSGGKKMVEVMKEPLFETTPWFAVVADEVHRAKNRKASQTKGLYRTAKNNPTIEIGATGTPLMNSPDELWSPLRWLFPKEYTSYWRFFENYVEYTEGYFGKVITGVRNPDGLRFELQGRLYRRTKHQVLDLPEKQRIVVPVFLSNKVRTIYTEAEHALWIEIERAIEEGDPNAEKLVAAAAEGGNLYTIPNGAARTVRLRQILSTLALLGGEDISDKLDALEDKVLDAPHKQHVVFTEFVDTTAIIAERLRRKNLQVETYTGQTSGNERGNLEDQFQRGEFDVIVGTIGAMREGITLTAADTQHWIERSWVPGWNEQGEDRCHRIGQNNHVTIYIYEGVDTVDDGKVAPTNRLKERIVKTVLPKDEIKEKKA